MPTRTKRAPPRSHVSEVVYHRPRPPLSPSWGEVTNHKTQRTLNAKELASGPKTANTIISSTRQPGVASLSPPLTHTHTHLLLERAEEYPRDGKIADLSSNHCQPRPSPVHGPRPRRTQKRDIPHDHLRRGSVAGSTPVDTHQGSGGFGRK